MISIKIDSNVRNRNSSRMTNAASIRELRTDFRTVKKKIEEHGEVIITANGKPAYLLKPVPRPKPTRRPPMVDYYARLLKEQPKPMSEEKSRLFWEMERGDR
jgi:antitoxin (DNA-binding transcriptional repressor) of toxin-antitoxin stability system